MPRSKRGKMSVKSKRKVARKPNQEVKKYVKSEIKRNLETYISESDKYDLITMNSFDTAGPTIPTVLDCLSCLDSITQGDGQGNRSGNRIDLEKLMFRGIFSMGNEIQNLVCKLVFACPKDSIESPVLADFNELMQDGNTAVAPNNSLLQLYMPFNKDYWNIKKTVKFALNYGQASAIPSNGYGQYHQVSIDLAKYLPKTIKYNDTSVSPTSVGLYAFLLLGNESGPPPTVYSLQFDGAITAYYKDA